MGAITQLNWVDLLFLLIFLLSGYIGWQRGLFGEFFYLFGLYIVIISSIKFSCPTSVFLNKYLSIPLNFTYIVAFLMIGLVLYLIFVRLYSLLLKLAKIEVFSGTNKVGGLIIGLIRGFAFSILISYMLVVIPFSYIAESVKTNSYSGNFFLTSGEFLYSSTIKLMGLSEDTNINQLLHDIKPVQFKVLKMKRKDGLEEFLEK